MDPNTLINPSGQPAGGTVRNPQNALPGDPDADEIGDLKLTDSQEDAIVAFLKALSDGYFNPEKPITAGRPAGLSAGHSRPRTRR